jgi:hypothetical protein
LKVSYPKSKLENIKFRAQILSLCDKDKELARKLYKQCSEDILFWFNVFGWTFDTRTIGKNEPFITFDFQDEYILALQDAIEQQQNIFTDKTRDMGVTWMVCGVFLHRWLFKQGEDFLLGSRVEDLVDKPNDISTLFGKVRYMLEHLPVWMTPRGWEDKKKYSSYMRLTNPETRSTILGAATSPNFGRGGRYRAILFDEFEVWENADEAWRSASDATWCKMAVGTPKGEGGKFAELHRSDEVKRKHNLMWWKHPFKVGTSKAHLEKVMNNKVKNKVLGYIVQLGDQSQAPEGCYVDQYGKIHSEWYDNECDNRDVTNISENLDCDYLTTGRPVFDTLRCKEKLQKSIPPKFIGDLIWKVSPVFNAESGYCSNIEQLKVEFIPNNNGIIRVWEKPIEGWENGYGIAADVAEGLEQGDFDSAGVLKRFGDIPEIVADIHIKLKTFEYAEVLCKLAVWYDNAIIAPERNGAMGGALVEQLFKLYNKIYHKEIFSKGYATRTDKLGWETHSGTKGQIIGNLSKAISRDLFLDPDEGFWQETLTFVNNDGTLEAQGKSKGEKCFDDKIMMTAILLWINGQLPLPTMKISREELTGWRKQQFERLRESSLVGWVV